VVLQLPAIGEVTVNKFRATEETAAPILAYDLDFGLDKSVSRWHGVCSTEYVRGVRLGRLELCLRPLLQIAINHSFCRRLV